ncbi:hypothetical protein MLD38_014373 [Melastoma candidum]|uniref:Uncharacterized protein n=1 Tax=Melastoma candidum TaxID=119954 RepID=A0ACB9RC82_9MYRT|nr:hypothetical protein MLD38_014373 [Melastoma candidum]
MAIVEDSRAAACELLFEEVSASSISILQLDLSSASSETIKGYKLWYGKSGERVQSQEPARVFPRDQRRIRTSNLQPCTDYVFHVVSYSKAGDFAHSEVKCFTRSLEVVGKVRNVDCGKNRASVKGNDLCSVNIEPKSGVWASVCPGFKVRDLRIVLHLASSQEHGCLEGFCCVETPKCCGVRPEHDGSVRIDDLRSVPHELDLNVATVPDLNEEVVPPFEYSRDDDNGRSLARAVEADDNAASHDMEKQKAAGSNRIDPQTDVIRKRTASTKDEVHDSDSTLISGSPSNLSGCLDENFEYCVKIIPFLECKGHINQEFMLKFLTWFSLRSTEQERWVVNTFVQNMIDDPNSLSGQLIDIFSDAVSSKRQRNDFFSKL